MIDFNGNLYSDCVYTIIYAIDVKEIAKEYPKASIQLIGEDGEYKLISVKERR